MKVASVCGFNHFMQFHVISFHVMLPNPCSACSACSGAMDFLYFDIKPYVRGGPRLFQLAINALDASGGSNTAIERDLFAPLRQLVLAGEEDGEVDFRPVSQKIEASATQLISASISPYFTKTIQNPI
jgi:hypothetical protein